MKKQENRYKPFLYIVLLILAVYFLYTLLVPGGSAGTTFSESQVILMVQEGKISKIRGSNATGKFLFVDSEIPENSFPSKADGNFEYTSVTWDRIIIAAEAYNNSIVKPEAANLGTKLDSQAFETLVADAPETIAGIYIYNSLVAIRYTASAIVIEDFPEQADAYYEVEAGGLTLAQVKNLLGEEEISFTQPVFIDFRSIPVRESFFSALLPYLSLIFLAVFAFLILRAFSKSGGGAMSFGRSRARASENVKVRFEDVAGADEEKEELREIVDFLKNPKKFTDLGARIPKGVLLVGEPGTGKTLLAKAVAGESDVPFLSISGSDFVEMFVGVGASRVRDLFEEAKKKKPCIVFIDEIDAVGRQRGTGMGGGNDEREQTLNQLLVEMDGFEKNEGIIIIAATNRSDVLDPALTRPGRFDRRIFVHVPDVKGREEIIKIHAKNKPIDKDVDFKTLARITSTFTGADLENMLNEAAILAARAKRPKIIMEDLTEGINKVIIGPQKKSRLVTARDKKITAYHESGHAILARLLEHCDPVQEVSIIPRGYAAGYTMSRPDEDDNHLFYNKLVDDIAMTMGGRIAEEMVFGDVSTGASVDIQQATQKARKMITEWGMSKKLGFMAFESGGEFFLGRDYQSRAAYSERFAGEIDGEIQGILNENYNRAKELLSKNRHLMDTMTNLLLEKETIYKDEVDMVMNGKTVAEIVAEIDRREGERKKRAEFDRLEMEVSAKITEYENKIKTAVMLVKTGVISPAELEKLQAVLDKYKAELQEVIARNEAKLLQENHAELQEEKEQEVNEKKPLSDANTAAKALAKTTKDTKKPTAKAVLTEKKPAKKTGADKKKGENDEN